MSWVFAVNSEFFLWSIKDAVGGEAVPQPGGVCMFSVVSDSLRPHGL